MNSILTHDNFTETGRKVAESIVSALESNNIKAKIDTTYLDYGQGWTWETILVESKTGDYQALNPRQFKAMNDGSFDYSEINEIVTFAKKQQ